MKVDDQLAKLACFPQRVIFNRPMLQCDQNRKFLTMLLGDAGNCVYTVFKRMKRV